MGSFVIKELQRPKQAAKKKAAEIALHLIDSGKLQDKIIYTGPSANKTTKNGIGKDPVSVLEEYCLPRGLNHWFNMHSVRYSMHDLILSFLYFSVFYSIQDRAH